jgi:hypothetical protein
MKLNVMTPICDLEGKPLKTNHRDAEDKTQSVDMVLADVLIQVSLMSAAPNKPYTPKQQIMRYNLALDAHKARSIEGHIIKISAEVAAEIKDGISLMYTPIVAGQVLPMLDGQ